MKNVLLASFTLLCFSASAQIKSAKNLQLQKGQKINVQMTNSSDTDMGMGMSMKNNSENTSILTVTGENEKEYILTNTLTKLKLTVEGMGQSQDYDSEKESDKNSEIGKALGDAIGKSVDVNVNKLSGAPIYTKLDSGPEKPQVNPVEGMMSAFGSQEPSVGGAFLIIPAGKKVGDTWTEIDSTNDKKETKVYSLKSVNGNMAQLTFKSDLTANTNVGVSGNDMLVQMNIKNTGDVTSDISTGLVSKRTTLSDVTGTLEIQGQSLPITSKSNTTVVYTLLKN